MATTADPALHGTHRYPFGGRFMLIPRRTFRLGRVEVVGSHKCSWLWAFDCGRWQARWWRKERD